ncbi:NAD(P)-dependent dehydrogenase (short-subunit alcohol dehydrogenase family) [Mycobacterium sp. URHB0021]|jgi:NAD(P)-dependent dehydrogenase (short-subunit alcohol dehydrogenase family)
MSGRLTREVAFITGAARGQGRAHAIRMAEEGAGILAVELSPCVSYYPATSDDLAVTVKLVQGTGRRVIAAEVDILDIHGLRQAVDEASPFSDGSTSS